MFTHTFPTGTVQYLLHQSFNTITQLHPKDKCIIITDANVAKLHGHLFEGFKGVITIPAGENNKSLPVINTLASQLLRYEAHRKTVLVGVGGGVVTDITGFIASIYMRGVPFGFVPTTLLGMIDAAIGGKNGINIGLQKNLLGAIQQPEFILYDNSLLKTLPKAEWANGFAEIIKYACLFDERLFTLLARHDIKHYQEDDTALEHLIEDCVDFKNKIVLADEQEQGRRKLLNFGHTAGHAFETLHNLPHGHAVALGMIVSCIVSETVFGLSSSVKNKLAMLLLRYQLPISVDFTPDRVIDVLKMDKKRNADKVEFIMLNAIGDPMVMPIPFNIIYSALNTFCNASKV
jgi:3-dehydroquinate synthase